MDLTNLVSAATQLSVDDRFRLVDAIWDSIDTDPPMSPLTEAQKEELDRRLAHLEAHPDDVVPWEEAKARILAKLPPA